MRNFKLLYTFSSHQKAIACARQWEYGIIKDPHKESWYTRIPLYPYTNVWIDVNMS